MQALEPLLVGLLSRWAERAARQVNESMWAETVPQHLPRSPPFVHLPLRKYREGTWEYKALRPLLRPLLQRLYKLRLTPAPRRPSTSTSSPCRRAPARPYRA